MDDLLDSISIMENTICIIEYGWSLLMDPSIDMDVW